MFYKDVYFHFSFSHSLMLNNKATGKKTNDIYAHKLFHKAKSWSLTMEIQFNQEGNLLHSILHILDWKISAILFDALHSM